MIIELNEDLFSKNIIDIYEGANAKYKIKRNTVIEFYLADCPHCMEMKQTYESVADHFPDIDFFRIEISRNHEVATVFKIEGVPSFILLPLKQSPKLLIGEISKGDFSKQIKETFNL